MWAAKRAKRATGRTDQLPLLLALNPLRTVQPVQSDGSVEQLIKNESNGRTRHLRQGDEIDRSRLPLDADLHADCRDEPELRRFGKT